MIQSINKSDHNEDYLASMLVILLSLSNCSGQLIIGYITDKFHNTSKLSLFKFVCLLMSSRVIHILYK